MPQSNSEEDPKFFSTPEKFRKWLEKNHREAEELWVGYYKVSSDRKSMTWPESVDQALCFGWIDGIRKSRDDESYVIRFTPRRKNSLWSAVNLKRINELIKLGEVHPAGLEAFQRKKKKSSIRYSYEQGKLELDPQYVTLIQKNSDAWAFFDALAPSYKKASIWWVMSAKQEETRMRRLGILVDCSAKNQKIPSLLSTTKTSSAKAKKKK